MKFFNNLCIFLCAFMFFSCSQSLDFNQIDEYTIKPAFSVSLTFFTIDATSFESVAGAPPITEISQKSDVKIFESGFIKDNLQQLDFEFEVKNEFSRDFTMEILLLDEDDNLIYKLQDLKISANNLNFKQKEVIDITKNTNVVNFTRVEVKLSLDDKVTPVDASDIGQINFKSAATIYIEAPL